MKGTYLLYWIGSEDAYYEPKLWEGYGADCVSIFLILLSAFATVAAAEQLR